MIHFKEITEENFDAIIHMKRPAGENFVASNAVSLAQAWLYREDGDVFPLAIYNDDAVVGFLLLEEDTEDKRLGLHRIIRQGISARDFVPVQSSENEGILYVFPVFGTAELVQKIR